MARWILPPTVTSLEVPNHGELFFQLPLGAVSWTVIARTDPGHSPDELADPVGMGAPPEWSTSAEYMARGEFTIVP